MVEKEAAAHIIEKVPYKYVCKTKKYSRLKLNAIISLHCIVVKRDGIISVNENFIQLHIYLLKSQGYTVCHVRLELRGRTVIMFLGPQRPLIHLYQSILSAHTLSYEIYGI